MSQNKGSDKIFTERFFGLKKVCILILLLIICVNISACTSQNANGLTVKNSSDKYVGEDYKSAIAELKTAGFTDIETKVLDDLILGWLTKDGEVEEININGTTDFSAGDNFPQNAKVVVTYHTFPKANESETKPTAKPPIGESKSKIITAKNNAEFAKLLALKNESDPSIAKFAKKYYGRTIEFDGNIANMMPYEDYKTRYDILVLAGNYSETSSRGPFFKFEDVNIVYDLHLTGSNIPENIGAGQNIHIKAKVMEFNKQQNLFFLEPVSTKIR